MSAAWTGIVLARSEPGDDRMASRLPTFLHPLAGRPLAWHAVSSLAALHPAPSRILLVSDREVGPDPFLDVWEGIRMVARAGEDCGARWEEGAPDERFLLVDARAPLLARGSRLLLESPSALFLADGRAASPPPAWAATPRAGAWRLAGHGRARRQEEGVTRLVHPESALVVRDRRALARASELLRDRLVGRLIDAG